MIPEAADCRRRSAAATTAQVVVTAAASALLLGACTASPERSAPAAAYTPPAWMAQTAQENELRGEAMVDCMAAAGYLVEADPEGGVSSKSPEAASFEDWKAQNEVADAQGEACFQQVDAQLGPSAPLSDAQYYAQMLDTLECLRAQGHTDLGDPPSETAWVEASKGSDDLWLPYGQLYAANPDITETEWNALKAICVEGGSTFGVSFGDGTP